MEILIYGTDHRNATSDSDGDNLTDSDEILVYRTDRLNAMADLDGDGLTDADEILVYGTDHRNATADFDGDGLTDADEILVHGTDHSKFDSDGDGLTDADEILIHGTDPKNVDSDGDGLTDADEILIHGTDPKNIDSDGDWLSDSDEIYDESDPLSVLSPYGYYVVATPVITTVCVRKASSNWRKQRAAAEKRERALVADRERQRSLAAERERTLAAERERRVSEICRLVDSDPKLAAAARAYVKLSFDAARDTAFGDIFNVKSSVVVDRVKSTVFDRLSDFVDIFDFLYPESGYSAADKADAFRKVLSSAAVPFYEATLKALDSFRESEKRRINYEKREKPPVRRRREVEAKLRDISGGSVDLAGVKMSEFESFKTVEEAISDLFRMYEELEKEDGSKSKA